MLYKVVHKIPFQTLTRFSSQSILFPRSDRLNDSERAKGVLINPEVVSSLVLMQMSPVGFPSFPGPAWARPEAALQPWGREQELSAGLP